MKQMTPAQAKKRFGTLWDHASEEDRNSILTIFGRVASNIEYQRAELKRTRHERVSKERWENSAYMRWFRGLRNGQKILVKSPWSDGLPWERGGRICVGTVRRSYDDEGNFRGVYVYYRNRYGTRLSELMRSPHHSYKILGPLRSGRVCYGSKRGMFLDRRAKPWIPSNIQKRYPELRTV